MLRVNLFAEKFVGQANGVTTAFLQTAELLRKRNDIELTVNGKGLFKYDILHSQTIGFNFILKSFLAFKYKVVVSAHVVPDSFIGSLIFSRLWRPIAKWFLKLVYSRASLIIAVSPLVNTQLFNIGIRKPIITLCNSVDRSIFKPDAEARQKIRAKLNIPENRLVAICVGQIQPRKGIVDFIETAKETPDCTFIWVGGRPYGKLTESYQKMTELIENAPTNVIFTGIVPLTEMPNYYSASDIFFMPSYQENFAFATIEAASTKLPLVVRDNIEYKDTLFDSCIKGSDVKDFTRIFRNIVMVPSILEQYAEESDKLANQYEINDYTDKLLDIYHKLLNGDYKIR